MRWPFTTGRWFGQPSIFGTPTPVYSVALSGTLLPTVVHGMRSIVFSGNSIALLVLAWIAPAFVHRSDSGLPAASVS
jgi:hypothetical protein